MGEGLFQRTSVNDLATVEVSEPVEDAFPYLAKHLLPYSAAELFDFAVDAVEAAAFAVFHRY